MVMAGARVAIERERETDDVGVFVFGMTTNMKNGVDPFRAATHVFLCTLLGISVGCVLQRSIG